jgi:Leucine Rich repeat
MTREIVIGHENDDGFDDNIIPINVRSLQHLVDFLLAEEETTPPPPQFQDAHRFKGVRLLNPSDGGTNVLRDYFARSDTTLTRIKLSNCNFGTVEETVRIIGAFQTNRTVSDLTISTIINREALLARPLLRNTVYAALGNSLSGLMRNMSQLQRLDCVHIVIWVWKEPGLQANRTVTELNLRGCDIGDNGGIRILADALAGNTVMEVLILCDNLISSDDLNDIARLIESTRIKKINLEHIAMAFLMMRLPHCDLPVPYQGTSFCRNCVLLFVNLEMEVFASLRTVSLATRP